MKAQGLSGDHLGRIITVTDTDMTVTGELFGIRHERISGPYAYGAELNLHKLALTIGRVSLEVSQHATVEFKDNPPNV